MVSYLIDDVGIDWSVDNTHLRLSDGFIFMVEWRCAARNYGLMDQFAGVSLLPDGKPAKQYASLLEEDVLSWIWSHDVDKDAIETSLVALITARTDPKYVAGAPWQRKFPLIETDDQTSE